jgi:hypothetical protein
MALPARIPELDLQRDLDPEAVVLVVEGLSDQVIVRGVLEAAGFSSERVLLIHGSGKVRAARIAERLAEERPDRCAVLLDLDERSLPDAREWARQQLGDLPVEIFCAVPTTEAWLFADDGAVLENASPDEEVRRVVKRLPLPEEIPDPKQLAHFVFGPIASWQFVRRIDVGRAAARSPSLRSFLDGMGRLLGVPTPFLLDGMVRSLGRDVIAGLIREVSPADTVIWRTAGGDEYTADDLERHIEAGDEIGRQYASDLLRVSRDLLRRTANRRQSQ